MEFYRLKQKILLSCLKEGHSYMIYFPYDYENQTKEEKRKKDKERKEAEEGGHSEWKCSPTDNIV